MSIIVKILFFALKTSFSQWFKAGGNGAVKIILRLLFLFFVLFSGVFWGYMVDFLAKMINPPLSYKTLIKLFAPICSAMLVWANFGGGYKATIKIVSKIYPISVVNRLIINILYTFFQSFNIGIIAFLGLLCAVSKVFGLYELGLSLLFYTNVFVGIQVLKTAIEYRIPYTFVKWLWVILFISILYFSDFDNHSAIYSLFLLLILQIFLLFFYEKEGTNATEYRVNDWYSVIKQFQPIYWVFLKNPKSKSAMSLHVMFKVITFFIVCKAQNPFFVDSYYLILLYVSPIGIFTYMGNNLFGFFPNVWLKTILFKPIFILKYYVQLIAIPLVMDFVISGLIILFSPKIKLIEGVVFYLLAAIILIINGIYFSLNKPIKTEESISFNNINKNISFLSTLVSFLIVSFFSYISKSIVLNFVVLPVCFIALFISRHRIMKSLALPYHVFDKIKH